MAFEQCFGAAEFVEDFGFGHLAPIGCRPTRINSASESVRQALEGGELGAYKPAQSGPAEDGGPWRSDMQSPGYE